jgi:hypothetical protein
VGIQIQVEKYFRAPVQMKVPRWCGKFGFHDPLKRLKKGKLSNRTEVVCGQVKFGNCCAPAFTSESSRENLRKQSNEVSHMLFVKTFCKRYG